MCSPLIGQHTSRRQTSVIAPRSLDKRSSEERLGSSPSGCAHAIHRAVTYSAVCRWFGLGRKKWDWVEDVTGPPMLLQSLKAYNATLGLAHVKILEPGIIFPIDWRYTSQDWKNAGVLSTLDTAPTSGKSCLEVLHVWGPDLHYFTHSGQPSCLPTLPFGAAFHKPCSVQIQYTAHMLRVVLIYLCDQPACHCGPLFRSTDGDCCEAPACNVQVSGHQRAAGRGIMRCAIPGNLDSASWHAKQNFQMRTQ